MLSLVQILSSEIWGLYLKRLHLQTCKAYQQKQFPNTLWKLHTEMLLTILDFIYMWHLNDTRKSWAVLSMWGLMHCLIVLNNSGNSEASLIRIFVLYFQMLYIIPEIILNFAQQERKIVFYLSNWGRGTRVWFLFCPLQRWCNKSILGLKGIEVQEETY